MPPPPLTPPPVSATPHMAPSMFQISYGHHHAQQGPIPSFSAQQLYMLPGTYARPETAPYAAPMVTHLNASNPHHQAPFRIVPPPGALSVEGNLVPQPIVGTVLHAAEARARTKAAKPKPRKPPPNKIVRPRAPKPGKVKQRPQMAKHLTPSLRAAIITLKVTDPSRSFKEIGRILSLPVEDLDDDDDDDDEDTENDNDTPIDHEQAVSKDKGVKPTTIVAAAEIPLVDDSAIIGTTDPNLLSTAIDMTEAAPMVSATPTTITAPKAKAKAKSKAKPKGPIRKPIPRNTVAGIFKRAVDRAGTDSDLFKLLEQTGRRAGSGRPRKGAGRKDREQQADTTTAPSSLERNTGAVPSAAAHTNTTQQSLDTQSQPTTTQNGTSTNDSLSQTMPSLTHEDSWPTHLADESMNGTIHDNINEEMDSEINNQINGLPRHSPVSDADADLTLDMGLDDDDDGGIDMDSLEMDALDMPGSDNDDVARSGWSTDAEGGDDGGDGDR